MRRTGFWLGVLAMVACAGNASAFITPDGDWSDWFTYTGNTSWNTWDETKVGLTNFNIRTFEDEEGPTPGGGGQLYDVEQVFYAYDDDDVNSLSGGKLYVGLVTGFPPGGDSPNFAGDLFLGLGNSGDLNIGIGVATDAGSVARYEQAYFGDSTHWVDPIPGPFVSSTPWRMNEGTAADVTGLLSPDVAWGSDGVHYFLEVCIELDAAGEDQVSGAAGGLSIHWTMGCGNDEVTVNDRDPLTPVPEPATMVLLGMGVLGIALRARRPQC